MELSYSYSYGNEVATQSRDKIVDLEFVLKEMGSLSPQEARDEYNDHFFAPGVYGRKMRIPQDMCVVGRIHKHAHLNVVMKGKVKVVTEFGEDTIEAPHVWVSKPGTKRAVYALEDTEWITIHPNPKELRDLDELEAEYVVDSYEEYDALRIAQGDII